MYSTNTRKFWDWKASVRYSQNWDLLWQSPTVWVQIYTSFLPYFYFQEKIWSKNWWMPHRLDQSTRNIPRGGYRARFFSPVVSSFYQTYKADKRRSCYFSTWLGTIHTTGNRRSLILFGRIMLTSFASHLTVATKCNPWIKLLWGPWKHSTAKKLENGSVQTQGEFSPSTKLANC